MVAFGGVVELWEALGVLAPVEFPAVNNDATNGCSMSTDPLGRRVHDYISAVVDRPTEVASRAKRIINLERTSA